MLFCGANKKIYRNVGVQMGGSSFKDAGTQCGGSKGSYQRRKDIQSHLNIHILLESVDYVTIYTS